MNMKEMHDTARVIVDSLPDRSWELVVESFGGYYEVRFKYNTIDYIVICHPDDYFRLKVDGQFCDNVCYGTVDELVKGIKQSHQEKHNHRQQYAAALHELRELIPDAQYEMVMNQGACELEDDFLGFVDRYQALSTIIPRDWVVVDLGCYLAAQSWFFKDHRAYVGVNSRLRDWSYDPVTKEEEWFGNMTRFAAPNTHHVTASIQEFIKENPEFCAREDVFAICSYVPDFEATELVRQTFKNCDIFYPSSTDLLGWKNPMGVLKSPIVNEFYRVGNTSRGGHSEGQRHFPVNPIAGASIEW